MSDQMCSDGASSSDCGFGANTSNTNQLHNNLVPIWRRNAFPPTPAKGDDPFEMPVTPTPSLKRVRSKSNLPPKVSKMAPRTNMFNALVQRRPYVFPRIPARTSPRKKTHSSSEEQLRSNSTVPEVTDAGAGHIVEPRTGEDNGECESRMAGLQKRVDSEDQLLPFSMSPKKPRLAILKSVSDLRPPRKPVMVSPEVQMASSSSDVSRCTQATNCSTPSSRLTAFEDGSAKAALTRDVQPQKLSHNRSLMNLRLTPERSMRERRLMQPQTDIAVVHCSPRKRLRPTASASNLSNAVLGSSRRRSVTMSEAEPSRPPSLLRKRSSSAALGEIVKSELPSKEDAKVEEVVDTTPAAQEEIHVNEKMAVVHCSPRKKLRPTESVSNLSDAVLDQMAVVRCSPRKKLRPIASVSNLSDAVLDSVCRRSVTIPEAEKPLFLLQRCSPSVASEEVVTSEAPLLEVDKVEEVVNATYALQAADIFKVSIVCVTKPTLESAFVNEDFSLEPSRRDHELPDCVEAGDGVTVTANREALVPQNSEEYSSNELTEAPCCLLDGIRSDKSTTDNCALSLVKEPISLDNQVISNVSPTAPLDSSSDADIIEAHSAHAAADYSEIFYRVAEPCSAKEKNLEACQQPIGIVAEVLGEMGTQYSEKTGISDAPSSTGEVLVLSSTEGSSGYCSQSTADCVCSEIANSSSQPCTAEKRTLVAESMTPSASLPNSPCEKRSNKSVRFQSVSVYYFARTQGISTVPKSGDVSLGMADKHFKKRQFPLWHGRRPELTLTHYSEESSSEGEETGDVFDPEGHERCTAYQLPTLEGKTRIKMLKRSGVQVQKSESLESIRKSRLQCGCHCENGVCLPETCQCATEGIVCQVDGFDDFGNSHPCSCTASSCKNPEGMIEFDEAQVKNHCRMTILRTKHAEQMGVYDSPQRIRFSSEGEAGSTVHSAPPAMKSADLSNRSASCRLDDYAVTCDDPPTRKFPVTPVYKRTEQRRGLRLKFAGAAIDGDVVKNTDAKF